MSEYIEQCLSYLEEIKDIREITIEIGKERKTYSIDKLLLSLYSKVFRTMFYGDIQEKISEITLPDIDPTAFKVFLKYIYSEKIELQSVEEAISSLRFADTYFVQAIKEECIQYLKNNMHSLNILKIYEIASVLQETDLATECMKFITDNFSEIIKSESIKHVSFQTILNLVTRDNLVFHSEIDMHNIVVKWGKERYPNQNPNILRKNLKPLLRQVGFSNVGPLAFIGSPCQDEILAKSEELKILKEMVTSEMHDDDRQRIPRKNIRNKWPSFCSICPYCKNCHYNHPVTLEFRSMQRLCVTGINHCSK